MTKKTKQKSISRSEHEKQRLYNEYMEWKQKSLVSNNRRITATQKAKLIWFGGWRVTDGGAE